MITHRNYYAMAAIIDALDNFVGEGDTMLLYLPLAHNFGRLMHLSAPVRRLHDRLPARPAADCRGAAGRPPDRAAERPARVREGARGCRRRVRRDRPACAAGSSTGRSPSAGDVSERKAAGRPIPRVLAARHRLADRLVYSKVKARLGGRLRIGDLRRRPAREGDRRVLPRARHPHPRGLRPDRVHDRRDRQPRRPLPLRHRRPGAARRRAADRRRRRGADPDRDDLRRLLQGRGGDARGAARTTGGCAPATSGRSTRTGSSRSPTARRTSSSPPAARTSRRRTSRTPSRPRSTSRRRSSSATGGRTSSALVTLDDAAVAARRPRPRRSSSRALVDDVNRPRSRFEQIKRFAILPRDFSADEGEITPTLKLKRRVHARSTSPPEIEKLVRACLDDAAGADVGRRVPAAREAEILTTSPVCGAWMNWPPPM